VVIVVVVIVVVVAGTVELISPSPLEEKVRTKSADEGEALWLGYNSTNTCFY
jgi:hypothetical protein